MKRAMILIGIGTVALVGLAGAAYAQQTAAATPGSFHYEIKGNQRVEKPDNRTVAEDGTVREEYRSGKCVTVKERRPDGSVKTSQKCD